MDLEDEADHGDVERIERESFVRFSDRRHAGQRLGVALAGVRPQHPVVVGLPPNGVPVAAAVAHALGAPLDVVVTGPLVHPARPDLVIGAIAEGGVSHVDWGKAGRSGLAPVAVHRLIAQERAALDRAAVHFRGSQAPVPLCGRTVIVVDEGLATLEDGRIAIAAVRRAGAREVILAVPVAPAATVAAMRTIADRVVCLVTPENVDAIGDFYEVAGDVAGGAVRRLLDQGPNPTVAPFQPGAAVAEQFVELNAGARLPGILVVPERSTGLVLFAHGSGSSRLSPRNRRVASDLNRMGIATLLFDLLTDDEATARHNVFDTEMLGHRLVSATEWCTGYLGEAMRVGYFGASTGAAAALFAAARLGTRITAVVGRGGRPDLAEHVLPLVSAATLLVVGGRDEAVLELNRRASARLTHCEHRLAVIPGATHLFEEAGALEAVATLAGEWFASHFAPGAKRASA